MPKRAGFQEDPASKIFDLERGYRERSSRFDKPFIERQLGYYKDFGLAQGLGAFQGKTDRQLFDLAAKTILARYRKENPTPGGGGGGKPSAPAPPRPPKVTQPDPKPPKRQPKPKPKPKPKARPKVNLAPAVPKNKIIPEIFKTTGPKKKVTPPKKAIPL